MNRILTTALIVVTCLLIARTSNGQGATAKLHGVWKLDVEATKEELKEVGKTENISIFRILKGITVTYNKDGKVKTEAEIEGAATVSPKNNGTWKVVDEKKGKIEIVMSYGDKTEKITVEFLKKDVARMTFHAKSNSVPIVIMRRAKM